MSKRAYLPAFARNVIDGTSFLRCGGLLERHMESMRYRMGKAALLALCLAARPGGLASDARGIGSLDLGNRRLDARRSFLEQELSRRASGRGARHPDAAAS